MLNLSDGRHTLLDIAERSKLPFATVQQAAELLCEHELLAERDTRPTTFHRGNGTPLESILH